MRKLLSLIGVVIIIVGIAVLINIYSPQIKSYIPSGFTSPGKVLEGKVIAKKRLDGALLLTVNTPEGATLITYKKKIDEIDLLVSVGDTIEFSHISYKPFLKDPVITRVRKETFDELKEKFKQKEEVMPEQKEQPAEKNKPALEGSAPEKQNDIKEKKELSTESPSTQPAVEPAVPNNKDML